MCVPAHECVCVRACVPMHVNECADTNMETRGQSWLSSLLPFTLLFASGSLIDSRVIGSSISAVEQGPGILLFLLLQCWEGQSRPLWQRALYTGARDLNLSPHACLTDQGISPAFPLPQSNKEGRKEGRREGKTKPAQYSRKIFTFFKESILFFRYNLVYLVVT